MIELKNLTTGYSRDSPITKNMNYVFHRSIYGILGKSGCGKTTLLRTIAGLMKPLGGEVLIDRIPNKKYRDQIYMMHQHYTSFDWKTCLENVLIAKRIKGRINSADIEMAKEILHSVKLDGCENKFPRQLSGGMRQRLALARTLFMKPKIVLMDEPLSALDEATRKEMQNLILKIHQEEINTIIMVTHSSKEADYMCNTILEL